MSFALDEETESLAAALSYLDDLTALEGSAAPLLLDVEPPTLDAAGWLGNVHEVEEEEEEEDPTELLAALTNSSLLSGRSQSSSGQSSSEESQEIITVPRPPRRQQKPVQLVIPSAPKTMAKKKDGAKKPLNYNPNRARDERRQELIYLRKKVSEMEEELAMLHSNKQDNVMALSVGSKRSASASLMTAEPTHDRSTIVRSACTGNVRSSSSAHSFIPEVWKDMCARQLEQRVKAERENIRLKLILEGQIKIAKSMEKLLKKRETLRAMETCGSKRAKRVHLPPTNAQADAAIYDALLAGVEESYREVDAVFEANGLNHMETSHRDAKVRDGVNGMYLEVFANKVLPFDMRTTGAAVWQHFKGTEHNATRLARSYYSKSSENFTTMEDTMVERFGLEMHANNTQADFHVKQILRRYVEKDRVVIVWRSRIEPLEFSNTPLSGIHFEEKGYVVTKPPSTMSQDFTLLKTCYIITPDLSDKTLNEDAKAGALTEFVLSSTAANITASHEMIENVLLDQALHKRSHH